MPYIKSLIAAYEKENIIRWLGISAASFAVLAIAIRQISKAYSTRATDLIKKYTLKHSFKASMGIQADIQNEIITLLKIWVQVKEKVVLIIEDLDRCYQERIIENIDALRVMLEDEEISKRLMIIAAIDERILKSAIFLKFSTLFKKEEPEVAKAIGKFAIGEMIREYMDKLFIFSVKLASLTAEQKVEYLFELSKHDTPDLHREEDKSESINAQKNVSLIDEGAKTINQNLNAELKTNQKTTTQSYESEPNEIKQEISADAFEKLTTIEINYLASTVRTWNEATPRTITIFYYRYLLCKNLLIKYYDKLARRNPWQSGNEIDILLKIIRFYHEQQEHDNIAKEKDRVLALGPTSQKIKVEMLQFQAEVDRIDYFSLLGILETVIAY